MTIAKVPANGPKPTDTTKSNAHTKSGTVRKNATRLRAALWNYWQGLDWNRWLVSVEYAAGGRERGFEKETRRSQSENTEDKNVKRFTFLNLMGSNDANHCQGDPSTGAPHKPFSEGSDRMPRRSLLSDTERDSLLVLPQSQDDLIQQYSFTDADLALIRQRRGAANRLGFAVQMCLLRYPGYALASDTALPDSVLHWIAKQVRSDAGAWPEYGEREKTRNEHLHELRAYLGLSVFGLPDFRKLVDSLADLAMQTDKAMVLAAHSLETLRQKRIILPALTVIERACAEAVTRANRRIYRALIDPLERHHKRSLDNLLNVAPDMSITWLVWLRQSPLKPNSRYMREHIERLKVFQSLALPEGLGRQIHQNRLLKMAREGAQMTPRDLAKFEDERRYATLAALAIEGMATVTDELVDLHDRIMIKLFSAAKNKHQQDFQKQGKAINDKVRLYSRIGRALVEAKESGMDPYAAIEAVLPWTDFTQSVTEAAELAQPETFDHLHLVGEQYSTLRRYTPEFLDGVISVFRESSTEFPRPGLTSGSAAVRGIPKVFECGAGLDRLDEPSRPPPLAGPGVAGSVAVRY